MRWKGRGDRRGGEERSGRASSGGRRWGRRASSRGAGSKEEQIRSGLRVKDGTSKLGVSEPWFEDEAKEGQRGVGLMRNAEALQDELKEEVVVDEALRKEAVRAALEAERQRESSLVKIQVLQGPLSHLEPETY
ncbi:uncharacterized protein A4U43_C08F22730 [Asparagus officinalis]|nr:uncharacterized protein A4U43_C08F22730 [Asparagus officinalis]